MFYPKSFGTIFVRYVFTLGWTGGIVCESAKIDLRKVMPSVCIKLGLAEWENGLNVSNEMHCICFLQKEKSHTPTHKCSLIFDMCGMINFVRGVIWICKDRIYTRIPIVLFKHHIGTFGAIRFCTLSNNVSCSSKREQIPHKNGTKWFGIKHSFIRHISV